MQLTDMDYIAAALSQGYYSNMPMEDIIRAACESTTPEEFDKRIDVMSTYYLEAEAYEAF